MSKVETDLFLEGIDSLLAPEVEEKEKDAILSGMDPEISPFITAQESDDLINQVHEEVTSYKPKHVLNPKTIHDFDPKNRAAKETRDYIRTKFIKLLGGFPAVNLLYVEDYELIGDLAEDSHARIKSVAKILELSGIYRSDWGVRTVSELNNVKTYSECIALGELSGQFLSKPLLPDAEIVVVHRELAIESRRRFDRKEKKWVGGVEHQFVAARADATQTVLENVGLPLYAANKIAKYVESGRAAGILKK